MESVSSRTSFKVHFFEPTKEEEFKPITKFTFLNLTTEKMAQSVREFLEERLVYIFAAKNIGITEKEVKEQKYIDHCTLKIKKESNKEKSKKEETEQKSGEHRTRKVKEVNYKDFEDDITRISADCKVKAFLAEQSKIGVFLDNYLADRIETLSKEAKPAVIKVAPKDIGFKSIMEHIAHVSETPSATNSSSILPLELATSDSDSDEDVVTSLKEALQITLEAEESLPIAEELPPDASKSKPNDDVNKT